MAEQPASIGIVKVFKDTYLYNMPGGTKTEILVQKGSTLICFEARQGWYGVFTVNPISIGYISSNDSVLEENRYNKILTSKAAADIFSGPGTFFQKVDILKAQTEVTTYQESNGFYRIGAENWVSKAAFGSSLFSSNMLMWGIAGLAAYFFFIKKNK